MTPAPNRAFQQLRQAGAHSFTAHWLYGCWKLAAHPQSDSSPAQWRDEFMPRVCERPFQLVLSLFSGRSSQ